MSATEAMAKDKDRYPGEMSEFDLDILGRSAVQIRMPVQNVADTLGHLRKLRVVVERAILILESAAIKDDRHALFQVKNLFRAMAMSIAKPKRRRF